MNAEAARVGTSDAIMQTPAPVDRERAIESLTRLLSSGHPLSEILDSAKRLAGSREISEPDVPVQTADAQSAQGPSECSSHTPQLESLESVGSRLADQSRESSALSASHAGADPSPGPDPLNNRQAQQADRITERGRIKLFGPIGAAIFWLIPTISLTIIGISATSLIHVQIYKNTGATAVRAMSETEQLRADVPSAMPIAEPEKTLARAAKSDRADPQMTSEEVRALLERGDALLSRADITSARLFYERAAAVGNTQAAVRLGATYDPAFLARAGLGSIRGDEAAAGYWYQRARDLGAGEAAVLSVDQVIDTSRPAEQVVTDSRAELASQGAITAEVRPQAADNGALIDTIGRPTRPTASGSSSGTRQSTSSHKHYSRVQRHPNGPTCPHAGRCLRPR